MYAYRVDFENGASIEATGLSVTLTNMRSGFRHLGKTNAHGFAEFFVPSGRYEESVYLPEWTHVPFSIEKDIEAVRFLETAKGFDAARRDEVELHKRGIVVYGETHDRVPCQIYDGLIILPHMMLQLQSHWLQCNN